MKVPGVCAYPKQLQEVAAPSIGPDPHIHRDCKHRRRLVVITPPGIPGLWVPYTHDNCVGNQLVSAINRVLGSPPVPSPEGLRALKAMSKKIFGKRIIVPWSLEQVIESFHDCRKPRYQQAAESFKNRPFSSADAKVNGFIKSEKNSMEDKVNPDPRMIQARPLRFNAVLAQYLRPMEKIIYHVKSKRGLRMIAKGLNQIERAKLIKEKWAVFDNPVCFSLDASRWDQHVHRDVLEIEHAVYLRMCNDPFFQCLLSMQLRNRCKTREGLKWICEGHRMSGDMNTALGNCLLMVLMISVVMYELGIPFEICDDGDDCLLFVPGNVGDIVRAELPKRFLEFGQELKLENEARKIEDIVFCQSKLVRTVAGNKMVRNWRKVLSHGTSGVKHWNNPKLVRPMLNAVGSCELALNCGVPILQPYAQALRRMGKAERLKWLDVDSGLLIRAKAELRSADIEKDVYQDKSLTITADARLSFEQTWGVTVAEQLAIERQLIKWELPRVDSPCLPERTDHTWVDWLPLELVPPVIF